MDNLIGATKKAFVENYANFKGRTNKSDFWWAILGYFIASFVVGFIGGLLFGNSDSGVNILTSIFSLATFIPALALEVRRLHDINKSGWSILYSLIPLAGAIILIIWYCKDSVNENNAY